MPAPAAQVALLSARLRLDDPEAIQLVGAALEGRSVAAAARTLGVPLRTLWHWLRRRPDLRRATVAEP